MKKTKNLARQPASKSTTFSSKDTSPLTKRQLRVVEATTKPRRVK